MTPEACLRRANPTCNDHSPVGRALPYAPSVKQNLTVGDHPLLSGAGRVQAKVAAKKVDAEYDRWHARAINAPSPVEQHFVEAIGKVKQIAAGKPKDARKGKGDQA